MAKTITRKNQKQFGKDGDTTYFGQFGSETAGFPLKTKNVETIQALSAFSTGWQDAVVSSNKAPFLEDMNSIMYVTIYQLCYLFQEGIPEWNADTTYFIGSMCRKESTGQIWISRIDDNLGNALPSGLTPDGNWDLVSPVRFATILGTILDAQIEDNFITDAKLIGMSASKLIGLITAAQIQSLAVGQLTGILGTSQGGTGKTNKLFNVATYTGNGLAAHAVPHGLGVIPDLVIVVNQAGSTNVPVLWAPTLQSGISRLFTGAGSSNDILSADATNIVLGTSSLVNANLGGYTLFAFKGQQ